MLEEPTASKQDPFLDLQEVRSNLSRRSTRSGAVRISMRSVLIVLGILSAMVLARLLTPDDFGLLVLANFFIAIINSFRDMGIKMAVIHHDDLDQNHISALFWFNVRLSLGILVFMLLAAPVYAWLYHDVRLVYIIAFLAIGVFILSLSTLHEAVLMRQMRFEMLTSIESVTLLTGMIVGIIAAIQGFGYWALVLQILVFNVAYGVSLWVICAWRPLRSPDQVSIRALLRYGGNHTGYNILTSTSDKLDRVLVGLTAGVSAAGFYQNAFRWAFTPVLQILAPLQGVAVASMSRVQEDDRAFEAVYRQGLLPIFSLILPMLVFMAAKSDGFILTLLGPQWVESIPIFRWLCIAAVAASFSQITSWLYLSWGSTHRQLRWGLIAAPLTVLGIVVGLRWGALGVAISYTLTRWILLLPEVAFCIRGSSFSFVAFFRPTLRPALASLAALAAIVYLSGWLAIETLIVVFVADLILFALVYSLTWFLLPGGRNSAKRYLHLVTSRRSQNSVQPTSPAIH